MDVSQQLSAFTSLGAHWVLWLLIGLSVGAVAIIIERIVFLMSSRDDMDTLREELLRRLRKKDGEAAVKRLQESPSLEARILLAGLEMPEPEVARERMAGARELARLEMERRLAFLGTVGNNAPFVGLLGTVIGIIGAFHELDASAGQLTTGLMAEIGEALVATAVGLLVALPAVAFFNLFQRLIRARLGRADALGREVIAFLQSNEIEPNPGAAE